MRSVLSLVLVSEMLLQARTVLKPPPLPDLVFIGPNDLAQSLLGYVPARGDEPEFLSAIDKIVAAANKHGKWSGRLVNNGGLAKDARAAFDTVAITGDTKALQNWYIAELEVARST